MRFEHDIRTDEGRQERLRHLRLLAVTTMYYSGRRRRKPALHSPPTVHDQAATFVRSFTKRLAAAKG